MARWCELALVTTLACGARTGLEAPPTPDAGPPDAAECAPGVHTAAARRAEVFFVLDRSGSMGYTLPDGRTRARALHDGLRATLPAVEATLPFGAIIFPGNGRECEVDPEPEVPLATRNAARLLATYEAVRVNGGTPTWAALQVARRVFSSSTDAARFLVLATDGGPSCNPALTGRACRCEVPGLPCRVGECIDDLRTAEALSALARDGVPTYLVGIDDPRRPELLSVLDALAVAGQRPRPSRPRYYSARRSEELTEALAAIRQAITRCVFAIPARATDSVRVSLDGAPVPRDPTRAEGWDWTGARELTLFGAPCAAVTDRSAVRADITCR
ncbi:MAG: VWA domain-containing protein [Deltaproteobacteria bacterium]|nr:VWA domain-containing protein [Deltaproteobacteria bacterium]